MPDRDEEQPSPEDARLIKRTIRAYFIQKNLPEAFPDWVGELVSEMVDALGRASQTMDPCAFLEAFKDLLKKHQSRNRTVLSSMIANLGSPQFFGRLALQIAPPLADGKDLYRFGPLYREVAELVRAIAPAESPPVKRIRQDLEVFTLILKEAPREVTRQVRRWIRPDLLQHPLQLVRPKWRRNIISVIRGIKRTVDATVDHYLAKVEALALPAVVVAISLQPDSTVDEIKDFAWRIIWRLTGDEVTIVRA